MKTININDDNGLESRLHTNVIPPHSLFLAKDPEKKEKEEGKKYIGVDCCKMRA